MPRQPRLEYPGGFYHLINRGIERRKIYKDNKDYRYFIQILGTVIREEGHTCCAWVLLPNHYHILVERGTQSLSRMMNRLQTKYAGYYNRKYNRCGRFYQNRYKAILCDKDAYFLELVAYIHLNPLRAGLVKDIKELSRYPWSGHRTLLGLENQSWQNVDEVLARFGRKYGPARRTYLQYLEEKKGMKNDLSGGGLIRSGGGIEMVGARKKEEHEEYDTRILGDGNYVKEVARKIKERIETGKEMNPHEQEKLMAQAAEMFGVSRKELMRHGKSIQQVARARALAVYISVEYHHTKRTVWAERFHISPAAISKLYMRGAQMEKEDPDLISKVGIK